MAGVNVDFRTREQWGAEFDISTLRTIPLPRELIFVHHNVITPTNDPNHDMLVTERVDIARFGKPSYKWAIHPSGVVLEGTTNHHSPDTINHNDDLSIMFMGNFENDEPTEAAMLAGRWLVTALKLYGLATPNAQIKGHRDVFATACPGANLYPRIGELLVPPPTGEDELTVVEHNLLQEVRDTLAYVTGPNGSIAGLGAQVQDVQRRVRALEAALIPPK